MEEMQGRDDRSRNRIITTRKPVKEAPACLPNITPRLDQQMAVDRVHSVISRQVSEVDGCRLSWGGEEGETFSLVCVERVTKRERPLSTGNYAFGDEDEVSNGHERGVVRIKGAIVVGPQERHGQKAHDDMHRLRIAGTESGCKALMEHGSPEQRNYTDNSDVLSKGQHRRSVAITDGAVDAFASRLKLKN